MNRKDINDIPDELKADVNSYLSGGMFMKDLMSKWKLRNFEVTQIINTMFHSFNKPEEITTTDEEFDFKCRATSDSKRNARLKLMTEDELMKEIRENLNKKKKVAKGFMTPEQFFSLKMVKYVSR